MALPPRSQGPSKKDLTPLSKGGAITKHAGKGSQMATLPNRNTLSSLAKPANQSMNNYAKATPMGAPQPSAPGLAPGLGDGSWAGNGM
jgi:hypothetical protein